MTPFVNVLWASGVQMLGTSSGGYDTDTTSHDVTLPTGTEVGDVNVVVFRIGNDTVSSSPQVAFTIPTGWTVVASHAGLTRVIARKRESGDPTSITIGTDAGRRSAFTVHRWGGAHGDVEASSFATAPGSSTVTPAWGSAENGYMAAISGRWTSQTFVEPTGYGSQVHAMSDGGGSSDAVQCHVAVAHRILESSSEQPGDWTITGTASQEYTVVLAVRPA